MTVFVWELLQLLQETLVIHLSAACALRCDVQSACILYYLALQEVKLTLDDVIILRIEVTCTWWILHINNITPAGRPCAWHPPWRYNGVRADGWECGSKLCNSLTALAGWSCRIFSVVLCLMTSVTWWSGFACNWSPSRSIPYERKVHFLVVHCGACTCCVSIIYVLASCCGWWLEHCPYSGVRK